ncbi:MAG: hypothetical protein UT48_C0038G0005 [Parcubacteria group bacterium GW2011_GWE2_39_37]|uniref:Uncharacterized protein n=1 Tax=Candidatus Falkowbacteria bacterium GW2011_GWF2_39_8 TaxID=1618642 RepID=A0A0G0T6N6_9BACT|nr:MAG: hypothetical protein UT48_C0038G0005 [Parcubacteria group bacterium GW2011_GWE2_39_37]KKR33512.1 MAG: hypothetical protein UT64_C0007G0014 [Candidatus Falkowbacteria bacterium GW2011_GWF2_39_8]
MPHFWLASCKTHEQLLHLADSLRSASKKDQFLLKYNEILGQELTFLAPQSFVDEYVKSHHITIKLCRVKTCDVTLSVLENLPGESIVADYKVTNLRDENGVKNAIYIIVLHFLQLSHSNIPIWFVDPNDPVKGVMIRMLKTEGQPALVVLEALIKASFEVSYEYEEWLPYPSDEASKALM